MRERLWAQFKARLLSTVSSVGLFLSVLGMFLVAGYAVLTAKIWDGLPTVVGCSFYHGFDSLLWDGIKSVNVISTDQSRFMCGLLPFSVHLACQYAV